MPRWGVKGSNVPNSWVGESKSATFHATIGVLAFLPFFGFFARKWCKPESLWCMASASPDLCSFEVSEWVSEWVSRVQRPTRHSTGHFGCSFGASSPVTSTKLYSLVTDERVHEPGVIVDSAVCGRLEPVTSQSFVNVLRRCNSSSDHRRGCSSPCLRPLNPQMVQTTVCPCSAFVILCTVQ